MQGASYLIQALTSSCGYFCFCVTGVLAKTEGKIDLKGTSIFHQVPEGQVNMDSSTTDLVSTSGI